MRILKWAGFCAALVVFYVFCGIYLCEGALHLRHRMPAEQDWLRARSLGAPVVEAEVKAADGVILRGAYLVPPERDPAQNVVILILSERGKNAIKQFSVDDSH